MAVCYLQTLCRKEIIIVTNTTDSSAKYLSYVIKRWTIMMTGSCILNRSRSNSGILPIHHHYVIIIYITITVVYSAAFRIDTVLQSIMTFIISTSLIYRSAYYTIKEAIFAVNPRRIMRSIEKLSSEDSLRAFLSIPSIVQIKSRNSEALKGH